MDDVLIEKIREYRKMLKMDKPDLDMALFMKILDITNESSEVKVAIEPVAETGEWLSDTPSFSVCGLKRLDDGRLVMRVNKDKPAMHAGDLFAKLKKELKNTPGDGMPLLFMKGDEVIQLTEAFSHSMTNERWAGLPFDLVLGVRKRASKPQESQEEGQKDAADN